MQNGSIFTSTVGLLDSSVCKQSIYENIYIYIKATLVLLIVLQYVISVVVIYFNPKISLWFSDLFLALVLFLFFTFHLSLAWLQAAILALMEGGKEQLPVFPADWAG